MEAYFSLKYVKLLFCKHWCMKCWQQDWESIQDYEHVKATSIFFCYENVGSLELVSKELNHLAAILHVYAGGLMFMK